MSLSFAKTIKGIKFVYLSEADLYNLGFQHGKLLKKEINFLQKGILDYFDGIGGKIPRKIIFSLMFLVSFLFKRKFSQEEIEEMKGIADGSGMKFKWILLANLVYEIAILLHNIKFPGLQACSGFITLDSEGGIIAGKTTDFYAPVKLVELLSKVRTVFVYQSSGLEKHLTLSYPACLTGDVIVTDSGQYYGANDGGYTFKINLRGWPILLFLRKLVDRKNNFGLLGTFKKKGLIRPYAILTTNGNVKETYLYELGFRDYGVQKLNHYLLNTNYFCSKKLVDKYYARNWKKKSGVIARHKTLENNIGSVKSPADAIKLFQLHDQKYSEINGSIANLGTAQAIIYSAKDKKIYLPCGDKIPVTMNQWREFKLAGVFQKIKKENGV